MRLLAGAAPGVRVLALRTPTLPPATHTNTYVLGERELIVVDPASPEPSEQQALLDALDAAGVVRTIVLSHHHTDHMAGAAALRASLAERGQRVPILAHAQTAQLVASTLAVDDTLDDGELLLTDDARTWRVLWTPGHAPGHIALHDAASGVIFAGDLVAGVGTILIDPSDGNLHLYLASLQRLARLKPCVLLPSHGPALHEATTILGFYVAHRHQRTQQIATCLTREGPSDPATLAARIYPELPPLGQALAARQVRSHLRWMHIEGLASPLSESESGAWRAL